MRLHPRLTRATVELVRRFETFQPVAEPVSGGGWSVGYGHTASARAGATVSAAGAEALLLFDLDASARTVEAALFAPVNQRQFEALTAFCFNVGEAAFLRSSALARLNAGAELDAADEIERWRRAELGGGAQVVDALVRRRAAEKAHFLGLPEGGAKWPSARLRPLAAEGGETVAEPPPTDPIPMAEVAPAPLVSSAAMSAADEVRARLRRLIPEGDAPLPLGDTAGAQPALETAASVPLPFEPEPAVEVSDLAPPAAVRIAATELPFVDSARVADEDEAARPLEPEAEPGVAWATVAPPFDAQEVAADAAPAYGPTAQRLREVREVEAAQVQAVAVPALAVAGAHPPCTEPQPRPATAVTVAPPQRDRRLGALSLTLFGAVLFGAAVILILSGRPTLASLVLGVLGALLIMPGVYGLLAPQRPASEPEGGEGRTP